MRGIENTLRFILIQFLRTYRFALSPVLNSLGCRCRFHPSCSRYAMQAFVNLGLVDASFKSLKRILKCGPWHPGGIDELVVLRDGA